MQLKKSIPMLVITMLTATGASAQNFPTQPIRLIVPYSAGGVTDIVARTIAKLIEPELGQPVVIENKPGANGTLGAIQMINAAPDGHQLAIVPVGIFRQPHVVKMTLDPLKHLTYISSLVDYSYVIAVRSDSKWKSIGDLVKEARSNSKLTYGTPGAYSTPHLSMDQFAVDGKFKWTHVPYKGAADIVPALMSSQVDVIAGTGSSTLDSFVKKGDIRILATLGESRTKENPDVLTLKEAGYPVIAKAPFGLVGPAGMDKAVVSKLDKAVNKAMQSSQFQDLVEKSGVIVKYMGPDEYRAYAEETAALEKERMGRLVVLEGSK